jgi:hypothetical protein
MVQIPWNVSAELNAAPTMTTGDRTQDRERLVWHYMKHDTLELVLRNHVFQAGSIRGLNDRDELHIGIRRVRQAFKKMKRERAYPDPSEPEIDFDELGEVLDSAAGSAFDGSAFVLCFTPAGDDTPQWQKYAGADGFAVAVPEGVRMPVLGVEPPPGSGRGGYIEEIPFRWVPLLYKKRQQIEAAQRGLWRVIGERQEGDYVAARHHDIPGLAGIFYDRAVSEYVDAVASIKHKAFRSEREIRYVVERPSNPAAVHTRPSGVEFVKLTGEGNDPFDRAWNPLEADFYQSAVSTLPIREVRVGPGNDLRTTKPWLRALLDSNGYGDARIRKSVSPFR